MKHQILIWILLLITSLSIGKSIKIKTIILGELRDLNIYLPISYSNASSKAYPVTYLLDGALDEDFIHISGIVQFGSFSWINMIPESIVVGIGNIDRKRDFTSPSENVLDRKKMTYDVIRLKENYDLWWGGPSFV